jgi:hypothetical protein
MNPVRLSDLNLLKIGNEIQLTGAIYSGDGEHYLVVLPEEHGEDFSRAKLLEMDFTDWETFLKQTDFVEVQISKVDEFTGKLVKAIVRKNNPPDRAGRFLASLSSGRVRLPLLRQERCTLDRGPFGPLGRRRSFD